LRGVSFSLGDRALLVSSLRYAVGDRYDHIGFRVVCEVGSSGQQSRQETVGLENQTVLTKLNNDAEHQTSLQTEGQEFLPGILVTALDEPLRRQHGLPPNETTGLVIVAATGQYAQQLPVGSLLKEVNRVPMVDVEGAKQNLRPSRNLARLWAKGSYRYVTFEVDPGNLP